ncbi:MAG TPA: DUF6318 family protein [Mycobacteriales bacterium]|nr:DUF6318 family protein [Mycobacteriales bacterium]
MLALAAAVAAGCSGGGDAKKPSAKLPSDTQRATTSAPATSPPSPSSSAPSPTASTPSPPALIAQHTPAGAKATAEYFVETLNAVYSGQPQAMADVSAPGCDYCANVVGGMKRVLAAGGKSVLVSRYEIRSTSTREVTRSSAVYDVKAISGQNKIRDGRTHKWTIGDPRTSATIRIHLSWRDKGWLVSAVDRVGSSDHE